VDGGSGDLRETGIQRGQTRCEHQDGLIAALVALGPLQLTGNIERCS